MLTSFSLRGRKEGAVGGGDWLFVGTRYFIYFNERQMCTSIMAVGWCGLVSGRSLRDLLVVPELGRFP